MSIWKLRNLLQRNAKHLALKHGQDRYSHPAGYEKYPSLLKSGRREGARPAPGRREGDTPVLGRKKLVAPVPRWRREWPLSDVEGRPCVGEEGIDCPCQRVDGRVAHV
jgi:hypothetical protein